MHKIEEQINSLMHTLVSEFRLLQNLVAVTQEESTAILKDCHSTLMSILEDKEVILDQLVLLEKKRQKIALVLAQSLGLSVKPATVQSLLPYFDKEQAGRVHHFIDGISALSDQEHVISLNINSQAKTRIDRLHSTLKNTVELECINHTSDNAYSRHQGMPIPALGQSLAGLQSLFTEKEDVNLLKAINLLKGQETTYQSVIEVCDRTLNTLSLFETL